MSTLSNEPSSTVRRRAGRAVMTVLVTLLVILVAGSALAALAGDGDRAVDLGAGGAAVGVFTMLLVGARRPPDLDVRVGVDELDVRFCGWEVLWSLRREIRIPLDHVASVRVHRPDSLWSGWWHRRLGTVVPGAIKAGWFGARGKRELWDVRAGADVIDLQLVPPSPMSRLVLQVPDPHTLAQHLTTARPSPRTADTAREERP